MSCLVLSIWPYHLDLILSYLNNLITWIYNFKHEIKSDPRSSTYAGCSEDVPSRELIRKLIQEDWTALKKDLMTNQNVDPRIARYSFADFWKYVGSLHHKQRYKYLLVVIRIIFLIPVGSAECKRIFSLMNRILDSAPTISHRNLVRRMRVKYLSPKEPPLEWFDPAIDKFLTRRRHTGDL